MDARSIRWVAVLTITIAVVGGFFAVHRARRSHARTMRAAREARASLPSGVELRVPRATGPIAIDGELDEPTWANAARTGAFLDRDGATAHPYSDARVLWGDGALYLVLYAADEDLRATHEQADGPLWLDDAFHVAFATAGRSYGLDVSPLGTLTDGASKAGGPIDFSWSSGAKVAVERDGTPNDPSDDDEEWVVELAVPLASLGVEGKPGARVGVSAHRCDVPKQSARVCASFGERSPGMVLVLE